MDTRPQLRLNMLTTMALLMQFDTAEIECLHASVRRIMMQMGMLTQTEFSVLAARWMSARWRREEQSAAGWHEDDTKTAPTEQDSGQREAHREGRGGGGAFLHEQSSCFAGIRDIGTLAQDNRSLDETEKARLGSGGTITSLEPRRTLAWS